MSKEQDTKDNGKNHHSFFYNYQQSLCQYAQAFLPKKNWKYEECMSQYLVGTIDLKNLARVFYHNNVFHHTSTVEQLGEIVKVCDGRKLYGEEYNTVEMIREVMGAVEMIEIYYATRGIVPVSSCMHTTDWEDIETDWKDIFR